MNGTDYIYFRTGRTNAKGKEVLSRLPDRSDPTFGAVYASHMGALSKTQQAASYMTVPALIRLYQHSTHFNSRAAGTQRIYNIYLKRFGEGFATAPAGEIEREDILRIADELKPAAANSFVKTVQALYVWARSRGHVKNRPCDDIDPNEVGEHEPWPQELVDAALASDDSELRLAVHLLLYTAQRIGDVCAMRWGDVKNGEVHVIPQKTKRQRKELWIPLHSRLAAELADWPRHLGTILRYKDKPLLTATLRLRIQTFAKERGHKVVPHGLRKNAVNSLLEVGCSVAETASISGQSLSMVEHYARRRQQPKLASAAILKWERGQNGNVQN